MNYGCSLTLMTSKVSKPILEMCTTDPRGENEVARIETPQKVYREMNFQHPVFWDKARPFFNGCAAEKVFELNFSI